MSARSAASQMTPAWLLPCLVLCASPAPATPAPDANLLYAEDFENGSDEEAFYPPRPGEDFRALCSGRIGAWADGGVLRLARRQGAGLDSGAGLLVQPVEGSSATRFYSIEAGPVVFGDLTGENLRVGDIWALRLAFAGRAPSGRVLQCALSLVVPRDLAEQAEASRLILPPLTGSGRFDSYVARGDALGAEEIEAFVATARKLGGRRLRIRISWTVGAPGEWTPGDSLALDDIRLWLAR